MPVRDAGPADVGAIHQLIVDLAVYERLEDEVVTRVEDLDTWLFGESPAAHVTLATDDTGHPVGMAVWFTTFSTFAGRPGIWLEDLFVREEHRGRGYGRALFEAVRAHTTGRLELAVLTWNSPAIRFYDGLGGIPVDGWHRYRWAPRD
jgi:GNAT superfamily N-acetyltransferase